MSKNKSSQKADAMKTTAAPQEQAARVNGPRVLRRYISRREAVEAADRFFTINKKEYVVRFSLGQRVEHYILLISFTLLGISGLAQTYASSPVGYFILNLFGGIDSTRVVHHTAAFIFGILSIYHVSLFLYRFFMGHHIPKIMPDRSDLTHFIQMIKLDLGLSKKHPRFDRYNFEEKVEYWALVWGTVVMGMTGILQWFPVAATYYLPGGTIPVARTFHKWEAILAVLAILIWHSYHSVIKKRNTSIFSGLMSIEDMEEEHPQELAYLRTAAAAVNYRSWPTLIEIPLEDEHAAESPAPVEEEKKAPETASQPVVEPATQQEPASTPSDKTAENAPKSEASGETE